MTPSKKSKEEFDLKNLQNTRRDHHVQSIDVSTGCPAFVVHQEKNAAVHHYAETTFDS